jgi:hypothetical protein
MLIVFGLALLNRKSLFPIVLILTVFMILLCVIQMLTANNTLALLFPWRISILLVPLAVSVLLADLVTRVMDAWQPTARAEKWVRTLSLVAISALMVVGVVRFQVERAGQLANPANPMMNYVAAHKSSGEIYLIPKNRLENFRLMTGAAILVDFDSIPYRDKDVMEWYERMQYTSWYYGTPQGGTPCKALMDLVTKYGVTEAVVEQSDKFAFCKSFPVVYQDATYRIYALTPEKK